MSKLTTALTKILAGEVVDLGRFRDKADQSAKEIQPEPGGVDEIVQMMDSTLSNLDTIRDTIKKFAGFGRELGDSGAPRAQKSFEALEAAEQDFRKHIQAIKKSIK
jgi:hypothetical protein